MINKIHRLHHSTINIIVSSVLTYKSSGVTFLDFSVGKSGLIVDVLSLGSMEELRGSRLIGSAHVIKLYKFSINLLNTITNIF